MRIFITEPREDLQKKVEVWMVMADPDILDIWSRGVVTRVWGIVYPTSPDPGILLPVSVSRILQLPGSLVLMAHCRAASQQFLYAALRI